jgi:hypothetical protein
MKIIDFHTHLDDRWFDTPLLSQQQFMAGLAERLDSVRFAGLTEAELEQVLWRTSATLLHLDNTPGELA